MVVCCLQAIYITILGRRARDNNQTFILLLHSNLCIYHSHYLYMAIYIYPYDIKDKKLTVLMLREIIDILTTQIIFQANYLMNI